jgi:CRP-like cAMP-binding protein
MAEACVSRQHLVVSRRSALQRVAHLLCEQMARVGIDEGVIPLNQIDIADAAGFSVVHANRIFQELRQLGMLSKQLSSRSWIKSVCRSSLPSTAATSI